MQVLNSFSENLFLFPLVFGKVTFIKRLPYLGHKVIVKPQIVHYAKPVGKHFVCL